MSQPEISPLDAFLLETRRREKSQTRIYRHLAALAANADDVEAIDRLNELHADEQHHLSRITARLLEFGYSSDQITELDSGAPKTNLTLPASHENWTEVAETLERMEIEWYERSAEVEMDPRTRAIVQEIVESERHHLLHLGGKWMPA